MSERNDNQYQSPFKLLNIDTKGSQSSGLQQKNASNNPSFLQISSRLHTTTSKNQSLQIFNNYSFAEVKDSLDKAKNAIDTLLIDKQNLQSQLNQYEHNQGTNYFDGFMNNQRKHVPNGSVGNISAALNYKINMNQLLAQSKELQSTNRLQISPPNRMVIQEKQEQINDQQSYNFIFTMLNQKRVNGLAKDSMGSLQQMTQYSSMSNNSNNSYQVASELIENLQKQNIQYKAQLQNRIQNQSKKKESEDKQHVMKKEINSLTSQLALLNLKQMEEQKQMKKKPSKSHQNHNQSHKRKGSKGKQNNSSSNESSDDSYSDNNSSKENSRSSSSITSSSNGNSDSSIEYSKSSRSSKKNYSIDLEIEGQYQQNRKQEQLHQRQDSIIKQQQNKDKHRRHQKDLIQNFIKSVRINTNQLFCFREKFKNESEFYHKLDQKKYKTLFYKMIDYHNTLLQGYQNPQSIFHHLSHQKNISTDSNQNFILLQQQQHRKNNSNSQYVIEEIPSAQIANRQSIPHKNQFQTQRQSIPHHYKHKSNDNNYQHTSRPVSSNTTKNQQSIIHNQSSNTQSDIINEMHLQSITPPLDQTSSYQLNSLSKTNYQQSKVNSQEIPSLKQISRDYRDHSSISSNENISSYMRNIQTIKNQLKTMTSPSHKPINLSSTGIISDLNDNIKYSATEESPEKKKKSSNFLKQNIFNMNPRLNNQITHSFSHSYNNQNIFDREKNNIFQDRNPNSDRNNSSFNSTNFQLKERHQQQQQEFYNNQPNHYNFNPYNDKILYYENYNIFEDRINQNPDINYSQNQHQIQQNNPPKNIQMKSHLHKIYEEQLHLSQQQSEQKSQTQPKKGEKEYSNFSQKESHQPRRSSIEYQEEEKPQSSQNIPRQKPEQETKEIPSRKQSTKELTPPQKKVFNHLLVANRSNNSGERRNSQTLNSKQKNQNKAPPNEEANQKVFVPTLDLEKVDKWDQSVQETNSNSHSQLIALKEKPKKLNPEAKYKKQKSQGDNTNTSDDCTTPQSQSNIPKNSYPDNVYYVMPHLREKYMMRMSVQPSNKEENRQKSGSQTGTNLERRQQDATATSNSTNSKLNNTSNKDKFGSNESNFFSERPSIRDFSIANDVKKRIFENQQSQDQLKQNSTQAYPKYPNQY